MQYKILIFLIGFVIGAGLFGGLCYLKFNKSQSLKLNLSSECGVTTNFKYCGSNQHSCTVNCNICGCDLPKCETVENCIP